MSRRRGSGGMIPCCLRRRLGSVLGIVWRLSCAGEEGERGVILMDRGSSLLLRMGGGIGYWVLVL